jgi:hypothetical protein
MDHWSYIDHFGEEQESFIATNYKYGFLKRIRHVIWIFLFNPKVFWIGYFDTNS